MTLKSLRTSSSRWMMERIPPLISTAIAIVAAILIVFSDGTPLSKVLSTEATVTGRQQNLVSSPSPATEGSWTQKLTKAANLVRNSSEEAEIYCSDLYQKAVAEKNDSAAAVSLMNRACARMQMHGMQCGMEDFRTSLRAFPADGDAGLRLLLIQAACRYERFSGRARRDARIDMLFRELARTPTEIPEDVFAQIQHEVSCDVPSAELHAKFSERRVGLDRKPICNDAAAMLQVHHVREQLESGNLPTAESVYGGLSSLLAGESSLYFSESIVQHALVVAQLAQVLSLDELEIRFLEKALNAAMATQCETLLTRCQLRLNSFRERSGIELDVDQVCKLFAAKINQINDRDLLRQVVQAFAARSRNPSAVNLIKACIIRTKELQGMLGISAEYMPTRMALDDSKVIEKQTAQMDTQAIEAESNSRRWRFWLEIGCLVLIGLSGVLIRERWRLRQANERLKAEIEQNERQRLEHERMELQLAQTERLESLGAIAGGIAHDFNNLLVGVIGNADLLKRDMGPNARSASYVEGILRSAEAAADLSHKMLAYAGKQPSQKEVVELNTLLGRMMPLFRSGLGSRHSIQFQPSESDIYTSADVTQLEQIAMNLLTNAVQAMTDQPGSITVRTGQCVLPHIPLDIMTIGKRKDGGEFVWFEFIDSGPGIPLNVQARVFEPFFSTKRQKTGHGFGLSVVYGHVNRHQGLIQLFSTEGRGTTFRVLLPKCESAATHETPSIPRSSEELKRSAIPHLVVIVDDRRDVLDVLENVLRNAGLQTQAFTSCTDAIEYLIDHSEITCLILDIFMPEFDGIAMLQELKHKRIDIPVVVVSGYSTASPESLTHQFPNVKAVIQKPFRVEKVLTVVLQTIEERVAAKGSTDPLNTSSQG